MDPSLKITTSTVEYIQSSIDRKINHQDGSCGSSETSPRMSVVSGSVVPSLMRRRNKNLLGQDLSTLFENRGPHFEKWEEM